MRGRLVSSVGDHLLQQEHVFVRSLDGSLERVVDTHEEYAQAESSAGAPLHRTGAHVFDLELPAGRFEAGVLPREGRVWDPPSIVFDAPGDELVFRRRDDLERVAVVLHALDARSGEVVGEACAAVDFAGDGSFFQRWSLCFPGNALEVTLNQPFAWAVYANGYRPAHGDEHDLERTAQGLSATVRLQPGFGARLQLRAVSAEEWSWGRQTLRSPPLAGATVLADDRVIGRSDAAGRVDIELEHSPTRLEIQASGWSVLNSYALERLVQQDGAFEPDVVIWMVHD